VRALAWGHARVIHQCIQPAKRRESFLKEGLPLCSIVEIAAHRNEFLAGVGGKRMAKRDCFLGSRFVTREMNRHAEPRTGARLCDATAEAAAGTRHQNDWTCVHCL